MTTRFSQCILASCLLPWREDFTLDEIAFRKHIRSTVEQGFHNVYLMGTAGEGYAVTDRQFDQAVAIFADELRDPDLHPMIGVISLSMPQILERIGLAWQRGIQQFQISLPSWGALTDHEMMDFFQGVCGAFPDAVFLHYNLPRAKRLVTGEEYRRIADSVPNLVATKNSTSNHTRIADLMTHAPNLQHFFLENSFALGCLFGECSLLAGYGALFPTLVHRLFSLGRERNVEALMQAHQSVNQIGRILFENVTNTYIDGAYDKLYVWLRDPAFPLRLLPPYRSFSEEDAEAIRRRFEGHFGSRGLSNEYG